MSKPTVVAERDSSQRNSPISDSITDQSTVLIATAARVCYWNGERFDEGAAVDRDGTVYECSLGHWVKRQGD